MSKISLKSKILITIFIPIFFVLYFAGTDIDAQYRSYSQAEFIIESSSEIKNISELIGSLQIERGLSATFLAGADVATQLQERRNKTSGFLSKINQVSKISNVSKDLNESLERVRSKIDSKSVNAAEAISFYTDEIKKSLESYSITQSEIQEKAIVDLMQILLNLEFTRENGGVLRANASSVLTAKKPITSQRLMEIVAFFELAEFYLKAPSNKNSKETQQAIENFLKSSHWQEVSESIVEVITHYRTGEFSRDGQAFFTVITQSLNSLEQIIHLSLELLSKKALAIKDTKQSYLLRTTLILVLLIVAIVFIALKLSSQITKALIYIVDSLNSRAGMLKETCENLKLRSSTLSSASTQQAASLTETATALEEGAAMITKTTNAVGSSTKMSQETLSSSLRGEEGILEMNQAIQDIHDAMNEIQNQVEQGKQDIIFVGELMQQIQEKATVINDIVFQTKLLSFNASVEANRAGEHGKGFSIVAEEVGRLAEMSGKQANEISTIIKSSVEKVDAIVHSTETRLNEIKAKSQSSMTKGISKSDFCKEVFKTIKSSAQEVDVQLNDVNVASKEQMRGVEEIRTAMNELDQATNQNAQVAHEVKNVSEKMEEVGSEIFSSIVQLKDLTFGRTS